MEQAVEVRAAELPPAHEETLIQLRKENCNTSSKDFKLQSFQLFLRRILSPDSPTRNMLLFHGTGQGKTCTAIQVAEEYILRPEFQDKKVLVLASAAVQENFRTQVFDVNRVKVDPAGIFQSQQCTGRRYLDMLQRAQTEGLRWEDPESREKMNAIIQSMIDDFYEFRPYQSWGNLHESKRITLSPADYAQWIHDTYDGRLVIVDEAHNLREGEDTNKLVADALTQVTKVATGMTLVLLSATPMFDSFEEIMFFFNLFLWNDHRQDAKTTTPASALFDKSGEFKSPEAEATFRSWCHEYVSVLRGESPLTFPFRLPPPTDLLAAYDRTTDIRGKPIAVPLKHLPLTVSYLEEPQASAVKAIQGGIKDSAGATVIVSPDGRPLQKCFERGTNIEKAQFRYAKDVPPFLSPSNLSKYATKFKTVLDCITDTSGIVFVYSNFVRGGVLQFAMALEEAGFEPAIGPKMLETTSGEYTGPSRGKYAFLTSEMRERQLEQLIRRLRRPENAQGQDIRIILGSPLVSEGIDFKNVRQVHILDPWYNMSRLEQVIGRGLRTCSHAGLDYEDQNCTVYLHTSRYRESAQETYDEYMYRVYVEGKAKTIAKVKRVISESAMDCSLQLATNQLPQPWRDLPVTQRRSQDQERITMPLSALSAPTFEDGTPALVCSVFERPAEEEPYVRPLGAYFDIRDEVFDRILELFQQKPIWSTEDLLASKGLQYAPEVVHYLLQDAVHSHLKLKDKSGRVGVLENRDGMYAFEPAGVENGTAVERSGASPGLSRATFPKEEEKKEPEEEKKAEEEEEEEQEEEEEYAFPFDASGFSEEVKEWFIIDQVIPHAKKVERLKASNGTELWARNLRVDGTSLLAVSPTEIFDEEGNLTEPVGVERDAVNAWISNHIERVVDEIKNGNKIMCTVEDQTLKFAAFEVVDGHVSRIKRSKTIAPKACPFFDQVALTALVRDCLGSDFPPKVKTKEMRCIYLSLAVRTAVLAGSPQLFWVSPEVWSFIATKSAVVRAKLA